MGINLNNYKSKALVHIVWACAIMFNWAAYHWEIAWGIIVPPAMLWIIFCLYDKYLWKVPLLKCLVDVPNLNGTYEGKIESSYKGKDTIKNCTLTIKQTASHITIIAHFSYKKQNNTISESREVIFIKDKFGNYSSLLYYYQNGGSRKEGDSMDQHDGVARLNIEYDPERITLNGYYFTNRKSQTKGTIVVTKNKKGMYNEQ